MGQQFHPDQKVRSLKDVRNDGTFYGSNRGDIIVETGAEGFVCEVTEFLFEPVFVVHFLDSNTKVGFRGHELELVEDFDPESGSWAAPEGR